MSEKSVKTKEMGGYLELERFRGEEFYPGLHKLNLARTALVWLLDHIDHSRVFIPEFLCETVRESAEAAGYDIVSYRLDDNHAPVWGEEGAPDDDDILYIVNYFGQLSETDIVRYRDDFAKVIVDNAQAFYDRPVEGVHTIYSLRKFFGVADGAYAASDICASAEDLPLDRSGDRVVYLAGRLEGSANEFYMRSKSAEDGFSNETPKQMSLLTQNIIRGIDYDAVQAKRVANYKALDSFLRSDNPFTGKVPACPYVYPFYHKDGMNLRKRLVEKSIYIPVLWAPLIDKEHEGSNEYDWSANILCLPVDQRYDADDMRYMAELILG